MPLAPGPVIDPDEARWRHRVVPEPLQPSKEGIRAGRHGQPDGEAGPGLAAEAIADRLVSPTESGGGASVRLGEAREPLGEDAARAVGLRAGEAADGDPEPDRPAGGKAGR